MLAGLHVVTFVMLMLQSHRAQCMSFPYANFPCLGSVRTWERRGRDTR